MPSVSVKIVGLLKKLLSSVKKKAEKNSLKFKEFITSNIKICLVEIHTTE